VEEVEEEKKTKAELKAEKKAEAEAVKKARAEEKAKKKAEAEAAKKARAEEKAKKKAEAEAAKKARAEEKAKKKAEAKTKTKAELKAEKKAEAEAVKKARAEEKAKKKAEAEAAKKAKKEETKKPEADSGGASGADSGKDDKDGKESGSTAAAEKSGAGKRFANKNKFIIVALLIVIPSLVFIVMLTAGMIGKSRNSDRARVKIESITATEGLINEKRGERTDFEMAPYFIPLHGGDGIVKLRISLLNLKNAWGKRIVMNPDLYRKVVVEAFEGLLAEEITDHDGQEAVLTKIESNLRNLMGEEILEGIIVREFNVL